jgi:G6PDH family F420-dependent oxidoreductase
VSRRGQFYRVQNAQLYTLPESLPPIRVAAGGARMAKVAARIGDGLISTTPDKEVIDAYRDAGGTGPLIGQLSVSWATSEAKARRTAFEWWPTAALHGEVSQELPNPSQFTDLAKGVTEDQVAEVVLCSPDADRHLERIDEYAKAGYDHVYIHQIGPDQDGFIDFAAREILSKVGSKAAPAFV